jgi:hypothetical protein
VCVSVCARVRSTAVQLCNFFWQSMIMDWDVWFPGESKLSSLWLLLTDLNLFCVGHVLGKRDK